MTCVHARLLGPCFKTGQVFTDLLISYSILTSLTVGACVKQHNHVFARKTHIDRQPANSRRQRTCTAFPKGAAQAFETTTKSCKSAGYWQHICFTHVTPAAIRSYRFHRSKSTLNCTKRTTPVANTPQTCIAYSR